MTHIPILPKGSFRGLLTLALLFIAQASVFAVRLKPESSYQEIFASQMEGKMEVVMGDRTRCDVLTDSHAIEVDFANKYAEAVGQSLNYSLQTGKRAGIALILEKREDQRYLVRLQNIIEHHELAIDLWPILAFEANTSNESNYLGN